MSQIHRVIILNKPLKIRGYTPFQWVLLASSLAVAFYIGSAVPREWKFGNIPAGFVIGMPIFIAAMVFVTASQMKPMIWWKNAILYGLKLMPLMFFPHNEEGSLYPDPSIIDPKSSKTSVQFEQ